MRAVLVTSPSRSTPASSLAASRSSFAQSSERSGECPAPQGSQAKPAPTFVLLDGAFKGELRTRRRAVAGPKARTCFALARIAARRCGIDGIPFDRTDPGPSAQLQFVRRLNTLRAMPSSASLGFRWLRTGDETFAVMLSTIDAAKTSIELE